VEAHHIRRRQVHLFLLVAGAALAIALAALPWHTYAVSVAGAGSFRFERTGLQSPEEGYGQLALVAALALVLAMAYVLVKGRAEPDLAARFNGLTVALSVAVTALVVLKLVLNTDFLGTGAWVSVVLGGVIGLAGLSLGPLSGRPGRAGPAGPAGRPRRPRRPIPPS
jgi:cell division protein FtsW (lipid II flippase)